MGVIVTIAVVLVAWCVLALVVGVIVGREIALRPRGGAAVPERLHEQSGDPLASSYRERA